MGDENERDLMGCASAGAESPLWERCAHGAAVGFAFWTLASHAVVAAGGSLYDLLVAGPLAVVLGAIAWRRLGGVAVEAPGTGARVAQATLRERIAATVLAALSVAALVGAGQGTLFWCVAVAACVFAASRRLRAAPVGASAAAPRERWPAGAQSWPWIASAACASIALLLHKFETDDGFYVAVAARAVDDPSSPLYGVNPVLGMAGVPMHSPMYKAYALEPLVAALSWLSGVPAIAVSHLGVGTVVAALVPLAFAVLFRRLVAEHAAPATAFALAFLLFFPGTTHGGIPFTQPWIGRTVFLAFLSPLIAVAALDLMRVADLRRFLRLSLLQVAAVGVTSTAMWAAPVTAACFGVAGLVALRPVPVGDRLRRIRLGLASCLYPVAWGLAMRSAGAAAPPPPVDGATALPGAPELLEVSLRALRSPGAVVIVWIVVLVAWSWQGRREARSVAIVVPAMFLLSLANPWLADLVIYNVTTPYVYERIYWALPIPVLVGLAAAGMASAARGSALGRRLLVAGVLVAIAAATAWGGFARHGWRNLDIVRLPPGLKVPLPQYDVATRLHELLEPGSTVLAVEWVSLWLPTFHQPLTPLTSKWQYVAPLFASRPAHEVNQRLILGGFVGGEIERWMPFPEPIPDLVAYFEDGLRELRPDAVCLSPSMVDRQDVLAALERTGYAYRESVGGFALWLAAAADVAPDREQRPPLTRR